MLARVIQVMLALFVIWVIGAGLLAMGVTEMGALWTAATQQCRCGPAK